MCVASPIFHFFGESELFETSHPATVKCTSPHDMYPDMKPYETLNRIICKCKPYMKPQDTFLSSRSSLPMLVETPLPKDDYVPVGGWLCTRDYIALGVMFWCPWGMPMNGEWKIING